MRYIEKKLYALYGQSAILGISLLQDISWIAYYQWNNISRTGLDYMISYSTDLSYVMFFGFGLLCYL